ncbi:MAG: aminotransferase class I/II-fold pyridoxal phosphate-dependent enzyme [Planctomycetota bacterium]
MNDRIRALRPYPMLELLRRKEELKARGVELLDFGTGDPLEPTAALIREAFARAVPKVSQYPSVQGGLELRESFCAWFQRRFGVRLDPEAEVLPTRGSKEAMFHLPLILLDPSQGKRAVLYPEPGYPVMEIGSLYAAADTQPFVLDEGNRYLMAPPGDLERTGIVWLSYPHNPSGQDLPDELFEAWVSARERHGFVLCSDECYTELYFRRKPRSLLEFGRQGCLVFHSLSKRSGMTGYRSGMIAGDAELIDACRRYRAAMGQAMPLPCQAASVAAWSDEQHVESRRRVFGEKRDCMIRGLERLGLELFPSTSTFYLWVRVPGGEKDEGYARWLLDRGILVSPGSFFGRGNDRWFRIALVPSLGACREALARWA